MDKEKKKVEMFKYYEVHAYTDGENGERFEANLLCTDSAVARSFARVCLDDCDSVTFDIVECSERLVL